MARAKRHFSTAVLAMRSIAFYRRSNAATAGGVAVAVAVLVGSLLVGESVRGSLREIAVERLGRVWCVVESSGFFTKSLAGRIQAADWFGGLYGGAVPVLLEEGAVQRADGGPVAAGVSIIGVGPDFWELWDRSTDSLPAGRNIAVSRALADELGVREGDALLVGIGTRSSAPVQSFLGRRSREETTTRLRVVVGGQPLDSGPGRFSVRRDQRPPRTVYVDLEWLQSRLARPDKANAILIASPPRWAPHAEVERQSAGSVLGQHIWSAAQPEDFGLRVLPRPERDQVALMSDSVVVPEAFARAAERLAASRPDVGAPASVSVYLANSISLLNGSGDPVRSVPYSVIAGINPIDRAPLGPLPVSAGSAVLGPHDLLLNAWTADDLGASPGDGVRLTYYVVDEDGVVVEASREFILRGVLGMSGSGADPGLSPEFEGITGAATMSEWDPPFPMDVERLRDRDEEYWDTFRAAPKAFIALEAAHEIWQAGSPSGAGMGWRTSVVFAAQEDARTLADAIARELPPELASEGYGLRVRPVRAEALDAARGSTDFGTLFLAMSMFLVASSAALVALLCRLTIERRAAQYGVMIATGWGSSKAARVLLLEGCLVASTGVVAGVPLGVGYAGGIVYALRRWWSGAVADLDLSLHVGPGSIVIGAVVGFVVSAAAIWWAARMLKRVRVLSLLAGWRALEAEQPERPRRLIGWLGGGLVAAGMAFVVLGLAQVVAAAGAYFAGGALLLVGAVSLVGTLITRTGRRPARRDLSLTALAWRGASRNWTRSVLIVGLLATASFVIVTVAANQKDVARVDTLERTSGSGGFNLRATCPVPLHLDLGTDAGRRALGFTREASDVLGDATVVSLLSSGGDDASCLNMQRPQSPRVLGAPEELIERGGFTFAGTAAKSPQRGNPWNLLTEDLPPAPDGTPVVPAFADGASAQWILKVGLGDDVVVPAADGGNVRLRLVGLLRSSIFAGELLVSEKLFREHLGADAGYRYFLIETTRDAQKAVRTALAESLGDLGLEIESAADVLAGYARVQNTYLATFRTLGGLGVLLGTFGVVAVLLRGVVERRSELAMLLAVGLSHRLVAAMIVLENGLLLVVGVALGALAALVAVAPQLASALADVGWLQLAVTLALCLAVGLGSCAVAAALSVRQDLIPALRAE